MLQIGATLNNRYEIISKIGSGGMSYVYKAKDSTLGRNVAIKVLKEEFCLDEGFVRKFKVEAQSAASLSHHNIVNIYDVGNEGRIHFIVMEYLEGETLKEYIRNHGVMSENMQLKIALSIASALEHAHSNHIIHRDIKPQNIMLTNDGKIKVTDFGIARVASDKTIDVPENASGSVYYISPEQARGGYQDNKSDLYSLGITMYEMATGQLPFTGENAVNVALKQIHDPMPNPKDINDALSSNIETIILKATKKKTSMRYQSAAEMVTDIKRAIKNPEAMLHYKTENPSDETIIMADAEMKHIWSKAEVKEYSGKKDPLERVIVFSGIVLALLVVLLIAVLAMNNLTEEYVPINVDVPDLSGKTLQQATDILTGLGLEINELPAEYNELVEKGLVISHEPNVGSVVREEATIKVVVSKGIQLERVISVVQQEFEEAKTSLEANGFIVEVLYEHNDIIKVGTVIKQEPLANVEVSKGTEVTIYVSQGPEEIFVKVPDIRNLSLEEASSTLQRLGLEAGYITYIYDDNVPEQSVIAMSTEVNKEVKEGYIVDLTVSLGKEIKYVTKVLTVNNILDQDQTECELTVNLEYVDPETGETVVREAFNGTVNASQFPFSFDATAIGEVTVHVLKDGVQVYPYVMEFVEIGGQ